MSSPKSSVLPITSSEVMSGCRSEPSRPRGLTSASVSLIHSRFMDLMTYHLKSLRNSSDISWTIESRPCTRCLDDYGLSNNLIYLVASPSKVDDPCSNSASNSLRMEGRGKQGIYRATYSLNCPTNGLPFTWGKTQT